MLRSLGNYLVENAVMLLVKRQEANRADKLVMFSAKLNIEHWNPSQQDACPTIDRLSKLEQ
jgi:hypothetical protein